MTRETWGGTRREGWEGGRIGEGWGGLKADGGSTF